MQHKYTIRIQRTEYYHVDVAVEAEDSAAAIQEVCKREEAGEFDSQFSAFDDVDTHVYCAEESEVRHDV